VLLYFVPTAYRYAPNFGYSAAAVGMSDRVESTVHKVSYKPYRSSEHIMYIKCAIW
jgi:hypothetical protein